MEIGDAIIRPSSKGNNHLTISWKVNTNCYQHIDVLEDKKLNEFSIGKRLIIDGEEFEDLDEILARHIGSLTTYVREILAHKNYRDAEQLDQSQPDQDPTNVAKAPGPVKIEHIERALLDEREKNKAKIPYMFTCCTDMPGKFLLSYLIKVRPVIFACSNYLQTDQCFYVCNIKFSSNYYIL
jgi:transcription elongation factor SPT6